jgi:glucan endo-1,3-alpha-glucosidase
MEKHTSYFLKYITVFALFYLNTIVSEAQTKKVFAHYMVCNRSYGNGSIDGYKQDIKDAQEMGVDGFALNTGAWDVNYQQNMARLFQAASELGTDFKFFISIDRCCGLTDQEMLAMIKSYVNHLNYFKYNDRPLLSAWAGGGGVAGRDWWINSILNPLKNSGYNMYFVPYMFTTDYDESPDYNKYLSNYNTWWKNFLNGYFYFGAVGLPAYTEPSLLTTGEAAAKVFHDNGNTYMGTVSPYYWGEKQTSAGRRYYEYHGGEGIAAQWKSLLDIQKPEWIELTTWNDWGEGSYFSPMDDINKYWPYAGHPKLGFYKTHRGFAELNKYYINWYKSGVQPSINNDNIYFFYRTHPKDLVAVNDPLGAVAWRFGDVKDEIHVTTILAAPAELRVITGGVTKSYNVAEGIVHTRIPFNTGAQSFELWRNGVRVVQKQGENILSAITEYDFNVYSESVSSAPVVSVPAALSDLAVTDFSWSPANPSPGQPVTFKANVKNQGMGPTPAGTIIGVLFTLDGVSYVWSDNITSSLVPGASITATASGSPSGSAAWIAIAGNHSIEANVDDINRIKESNETNNRLSKNMIVPMVSSGTGLTAQYFDNMDFTNSKLTRTDSIINFNWGSGSPVSAMGVDQFSVRWTGQVQAKYSETYTFYTNSDDGIRLWVNGQQIINNWTDHAPTENKGTISLVAGQKYDIKIEFYENGGGALASLSWSSISQGKQIIPKSQLYNTSVLARVAISDEQEINEEISIYPNPAQGEISIIFHSEKNTEINIVINDINSVPKLNKAVAVIEGENHLILDISKLSPGMYFVNIISADKKIIRKIIVT